MPYQRLRQTFFLTNVPSNRARNLWTHVIAMGGARLRPGFQEQPPFNRAGYILHYIRTGALDHQIKGKNYVVPAGHACLLDISAGHRHRNAGTRTVQAWWVYFNGPDFSRVFSDLGCDLDPVFRLADPVRFKKLFHELWTIIAGRTAAFEVKSHAVLQQLITELYLARVDRLWAQSLIPDKSHLSDSTRMAIGLIEGRPDWPVQLKMLATQAGLSVCYFASKFQAECGMSPMQYVARYRIEQAKFILRTTNKSVREIASMVGMQNGNYLANRFRRATGLTPQQYRRQSLNQTAQPSARNTQTHS